MDNLTEKDNDKDCPYRKLIVGPSGSGKTNYLLNSIQKDDIVIDKIYLYAKDLEESKYQLLINKKEKAGINFNNDPTAFSILILWMIFFLKLKTITKREKRKYL